jgi:CheY-like chemotaxis protein
LGKGSTFTVHLQAAAPAAASGASPSRPDIRAAKRRRILVVDDNRDAVTSLAAVLELVGHEVHVAYDGMQALEKVRLLAPEVVILDIGLPRMNGYEVCAQIKRSAGASPKVVALTGWGQETDRRRSAEAGFDEHLVKPVDFDVLAGILA